MSEKEKQVIGLNLKYLRKLKNLTQQELANHLDIRRSSIGAYEECRATPRYDTLERISDFFGVSIDLLVKEDLSNYSEEELRDEKSRRGIDPEGKRLRILPITVDKEGRENVEYVPQKASAGYLNGYADPEYITDLPKFQLPMLGPGSFRAFEIKGDSMLPLKSGTIVVGEYVENWREIKNGTTYIIVSETEGVVYKRVYTQTDGQGNVTLILRSDNQSYSPYEVPLEDVREVWKAKLYISNDFPDPEMSLEKLSTIVMDLQQEVIKLKSSH